MKEITMEPVVSSQFKTVGYDQDAEDLYIEFNKGVVYRYYNVPKKIFDGIKSADSAGSYFYR